MTKQRLVFLTFCAIGFLNAIIDIAVYTVILRSTHSILLANTCSTSVALINSFFLNSRVTFKTKKWTVPLFVKFAVVTLIGLWVLQFGAIYWITYIIKHTTIPEWRMFGSLSPLAQQIFPKLIAIGISFLWNFTWYSKVIFRDTSKKESIVMALDDL